MFEIIAQIIQIITNISLIVGVCFTARQLHATKDIAKKDLDRRKKEATMAFTYEILESSRKLSGKIKKKYGAKPITDSDYINEDREMIVEIKRYLNYMERISVGINAKVYDLDIFKRICGSKTILSWEQLSFFVKERRFKSNNPDLYIEFEKLIEALRDEFNGNSNNTGDLKEDM